MRQITFFLIRQAADYYTVVLEGDREKAAEALRSYFPEVRFLRSERTDDSGMRKYTGDRPIGECIIRGCWFTRELRPFSTYSKPIEGDFDPRLEYESVA